MSEQVATDDRPEAADDGGATSGTRGVAQPWWLSAHLWFVVTATICTGMVVFVGIRGAVTGWLPLGDDGFFALRAFDVFTKHPPLVGTASSASTYSGAPTHHPGPLQFYFLAVPVRLFGVSAGSDLGSALINASAIGVGSWLLRRRFGPIAGAFGALCMLGLAWSLGSVLLHVTWGPWAIILPFALFMVAVGLAVGGDAQALPVAAVAGSLVFQTHSSYVLLVPGLLVVAFVGVLGWAYLDHRRGETDDLAEPFVKIPRTSWSSAKRWAAIGLAALVICWIPPMIQQARNDPGNFRALWTAAKSDSPPTVDLQLGVYFVAGTVALPPWWFPDSTGHTNHAYEWVDANQKMPLANVSLAIVVGLLGLCVFSSVRRRDRLALSAAIASLAALVLGMASVLRAPTYGVLSSTYTRFLWPISIWVWFTLGFCAVRAVLDRRARRANATLGANGNGTSSPEPEPARRWSVGHVVMPVTAVLALVQAGFLFPERDNTYLDRSGMQRNLDAMLDVVTAEARTVDGPILIVDVLSNANFTYNPTIMAEFAEDGIEFVVDNKTLIRQVGAHRAASRHEPVAELWLTSYPDQGIDGELIYSHHSLPTEDAERMEQLEAEISADIEAGGQLRLSTQAREFVTATSPELLADIERRLAAGNYTVAQVGRLFSNVYAMPLLWEDGDELDVDPVGEWLALDKKREDNTVYVYFVHLDE